MVTGHKKNETRGWATRHRGRLLIHSAKKWTQKQAQITAQEPFLSSLGPECPLSRGSILGAVTVSGVITSEKFLKTMMNSLTKARDVQSSRELMFGDYRPGRYAWVTCDYVQFPTPIPTKGQQGLFGVDTYRCGDSEDEFLVVRRLKHCRVLVVNTRTGKEMCCMASNLRGAE
jgi:hypothetical protein